MDAPVSACIALGSNLGERLALIATALHQIRSFPGTSIDAMSSVIETEPVGPCPQPKYLNAAATITTGLSPRELLQRLLGVEQQLGRNRAQGERWGPRTMDLDILLFGDRIVHEPGLTIPHPRLHERLFVLTPLAEIAPDRIVPGLGVTVKTLRNRLLNSGVQPAHDPS